jgi:hypothetical protein
MDESSPINRLDILQDLQGVDEHKSSFFLTAEEAPQFLRAWRLAVGGKIALDIEYLEQAWVLRTLKGAKREQRPGTRGGARGTG